MNYQLSLQASTRPETLERILRVTRHRGFKVESLDMKSQGSNKEMNLQMTVSSERALVLLVNQLEKLIDISSVKALELDSQQQSA